jgi:hypothetical protein
LCVRMGSNILKQWKTQPQHPNSWIEGFTHLDSMVAFLSAALCTGSTTTNRRLVKRLWPVLALLGPA